jgi:hypothetical protein
MKKHICLKKMRSISINLALQGGAPSNSPQIGVFISGHDESGDDTRNHIRTNCRPSGYGYWVCSRFHY